MFLQGILAVGRDWITRGEGFSSRFENGVGVSKLSYIKELCIYSFEIKGLFIAWEEGGGYFPRWG